MTIRYIDLLDVDLTIKKWEDHELEKAVREWWKKVNSTPWNPMIAAANFRLRLPSVKGGPEHLIRYPRAMADDMKLLRAITQRNGAEPDFTEAVIRQVMETKSFDPPSLMRIPPSAPEVDVELAVIRHALGLEADLHHVGVCDLELPRPPEAKLTIATLNGEYVDNDGNTQNYAQWVLDVYDPVRLRLSVEHHGEDVVRKVMHAPGTNVAPLLDALKERGLPVQAEEAKL